MLTVAKVQVVTATALTKSEVDQVAIAVTNSWRHFFNI